jgi:hypothetical protein
MTQLKRSFATFAVIAVGALAAAAPAGAQERGFVVDGPLTAQPAENGIIAILIGLAHRPFTPPIGSDKGS